VHRESKHRFSPMTRGWCARALASAAERAARHGQFAGGITTSGQVRSDFAR
jgi:hypothetical protein